MRMSLNRIVFLAFAFLATVYAGTKPQVPWRFQFNLGLRDAGSVFDTATGTAEARWTYDQSVALYAFKWQYRIDDGDWVQLPDGDVSTGQAFAHIDLPEGSSLAIQCYPQYVAPPVVQTNGVYHLSGVMPAMDTDPNSPDYVTPRVPIKTDTGDTLTPTDRPPETINTLEESHE